MDERNQYPSVGDLCAEAKDLILQMRRNLFAQFAELSASCEDVRPRISNDNRKRRNGTDEDTINRGGKGPVSTVDCYRSLIRMWREQTMNGSAPSNRTARAVAWLKADFTKALRVEELAQLAQMAVSTLHLRFKSLTQMSRLQFQKRLRLHQARVSTMNDGLDAATAKPEKVWPILCLAWVAAPCARGELSVSASVHSISGFAIALPSKLAMKAPVSSIANTGASSAEHPCAMLKPSKLGTMRLRRYSSQLIVLQVDSRFTAIPEMLWPFGLRARSPLAEGRGDSSVATSGYSDSGIAISEVAKPYLQPV